MQITHHAPVRTASSNQGPAPAPEPTPAPPSDGYFASGQWRESNVLQVGAWGAAGGAALLAGQLGGPKVGLLVGGAVGAVTGGLTCRSEKWWDKAGAAFWGFAMNSTVGIIGDSSLYGGLFTAGINGVGSGIVFANHKNS